MSDSGYNSVPMIVSSPGKYWTFEKIEEWKERGGAYDIREKPHRYHKNMDHIISIEIFFRKSPFLGQNDLLKFLVNVFFSKTLHYIILRLYDNIYATGAYEGENGIEYAINEGYGPI